MKQQKVPTEAEIRTLLDRYHCRVPYHAVRTRFLGNIATPGASIVPIDMIKRLWGGELPAFDTMDDLNGLFEVLIMGLWNQLTRHQERSASFRLTRFNTVATREGLILFGRTRREEIEGFVEGLFGDSESLELPERAHDAITKLGEMRSMFGAAEHLATDLSKPVLPESAKVTIGHLRELTRIAEHEIHEAVLSCARARRQLMAGVTVPNPTLH